MTELNPYSIVPLLKQILPIETWNWTIPALRKDKLVWQALLTSEQSFNGLNLQEVIQFPEDCTPASLALKSLSYPFTIEELRTLPLIPSAPEFEGLLETASYTNVNSLSEAGLCALKLRDERIRSGSWDGCSESLNQIVPSGLVCLFGMIPDQIDFLIALISGKTDESPSSILRSKKYNLITDILLANPQPTASKVELIRILLQSLNPDQQKAFIRQLNSQDPELANNFVIQPLYDSDDLVLKTPSQQPIFPSALDLHVEEQQLTLQKLLKQKIDELIDTQAQYFAELAILSTRRGQIEESLSYLENSSRLIPADPILASSYLITLWFLKYKEFLTKRENVVSHFQEHPSALIHLLELFPSNDEFDPTALHNEQILSLVNEVIEELWSYSVKVEEKTSEKDIFYYLLAQTTALFIQFHLYHAAEECVAILLKYQQNNVPILILSAYLNHKSAKHQIAHNILEYSQCITRPNLSFLSFTFQSCQINHHFEEALRIGDENSLQQELPGWNYELASVALHANSKAYAQNICKQLLEQIPDDGIALALYAEASDELPIEQRINKFEQALQLNPSHPYPWLAYARFLNIHDNLEKSLDVLKGADQTLPSSAEIQLALGKFYADGNQPSLALTHLRSAEQILKKNFPPPLTFDPASIFNHIREIPDFITQIQLRYSLDYGSSTITYDQLVAALVEYLGQTLRQLGHLEEAYNLLAIESEHYPENSQISYQLAKTLILKGEWLAAQNLLRNKVLPFDERPDAYLDLARCLWNQNSESSDREAINSLNRAIELDPNYFEAYPLLADYLLRINNPEDALQIYSHIFRFPQVNDPIQLEKLKLGLSRAALQAGKYELALTTLLECDQNNIEVLKLLAQTYAETNINSEAIKYANIVLDNANQDVDTLAWYAIFLSQLSTTPGEDLYARQEMAIKALEIALNSDPDRDDLKLLLGDSYYQHGQSLKALQTYEEFVNKRLINENALIDPNKLEKLACNLSALGDNDTAITCWKFRLAQIQNSAPVDYNEAARVLATIATIYHQQNDYIQMQHCYQQALEYLPDHPQYTLNYLEAVYLTSKSINGFLHQTAKLEDLQQKLENAYQSHLDSPDLALSLALLYRLLGKSSNAITILQNFINHLDAENLDPENQLKTEWIAEIYLQLARLFQINFQSAMAKQTLQIGLSQITSFELDSEDSYFKLWCEWIEQNLDAENPTSPVQQKLCEIAPQDFHVQAIVIKSKLLQGDIPAGSNLYHSAIQLITHNAPSTAHYRFSPAANLLLAWLEQIDILYSFSAIARQLGDWDIALELINIILDSPLNEPLAHFERLSTLVIRAEFQNICKGTDLLAHSPGENTNGENNGYCFFTSLNWLKSELEFSEGFPIELRNQVSEYELRGKCVLNPNSLNLDDFTKFKPTPPIICAKLGWLVTQSQEVDLINASYPFQNNPFILFTLSNHLQFTHPDKAIQILEGIIQYDENDSLDPSFFKDTWLVFPNQLTILASALYAKLVYQQEIKTGRSMEKVELALNAIQSAVLYYPDEPRWNGLYAKILMANPLQRANLIQASQALKKAIAGESRQLEYYSLLANLQIQLNQSDQAVETLLKVYPFHSENIELALLLSKAYHLEGDLPNAIQYADRALNIDPENFQSLIWRAQLALTQADPALSQELISRIPGSDQNENVIELQAKIALFNDNYEAALKEYEKIPVERKFETLLCDRVNVVRKVSGSEEAFMLLQELVQELPNSVQIQRLYAGYLAEKDRIEEAISAAQKALRTCHLLTSHCDFREHALCHRTLGQLFYSSGHLYQAIHHLSEAVQLNPDDAESFYLLGEVYSTRGDYDHSLGNYSQAIQIDPKLVKAYFKAGLLYKDAKDYPNAEQMFRQAAKLDPNNLTIQRQLGAVVALNLLHHQKSPEKNQL